jgi:hypothetical protein
MTEAVAGLPWAEVAASAYRAYAASVGNKNFRGDPMPPFGELPRTIQVAWECAVRQAGDCISARQSCQPPPGERRWSGWWPDA